jgi:hypothetical protein
MSLYIDENENGLVYPNMSTNMSGQHAYQSTIHWHNSNTTDDSELDDDDDINIDDEKMLGDGSDEDDSLLVIYHETNAY